MPISYSRTIGIALGVLAATSIGAVAATSSGAASGTGAAHAGASIVDLAGNEVGTATFVEDGTGRVHVNVKASGLQPGWHGIHIHGVGACTPTFDAAGGHHNPLGAAHGMHSGDLPNMIVNVAGRGRLNAATETMTLSSGDVSILDANGSALVIHALVDDFVTQPTGGSGARIACGVITAD